MSEWIDCKDRLPEKDGFYTVTAKGLSKLRVFRSWRFTTNPRLWQVRKHWNENVIAWIKQPDLPEPYKPDYEVVFTDEF